MTMLNGDYIVVNLNEALRVSLQTCSRHHIHKLFKAVSALSCDTSAAKIQKTNLRVNCHAAHASA